MKIPLALSLILLIHASLCARTFTSKEGKALEAEFVSTTETHVTVRREADGRRFTIPIASLSDDDQVWIASQGKEADGGGAVALPDSVASVVEARGTLLFEDDFNREDSDESDDLGTSWTTNSQSRAQGAKQNDLVEGELVMTISPKADHAISTVHNTAEPYGDAVVSLRMKLEEGDQLKLAYNDKEEKSVWAGHINGVIMTPERLTLSDEREGRFRLDLRNGKETPEGKAALEEALKSTDKTFPLDLEAGEWHEVVTWHDGDTLKVYIDGDEVGTHTSPGFGHGTKRQFVFAVAKHAVVDDLKIWKLAPEAE
ncbi:MAG: hypothetical protein P1U87_00620 [Verrucomicrobiales bacterium]|nr:hypothetical protein [Verrucomicrobiales bacterium]